MVKTIIDDVPYFNAPVYLDNKQQVGKIDEIFGSLRDYVSFFDSFFIAAKLENFLSF